MKWCGIHYLTNAFVSIKVSVWRPRCMLISWKMSWCIRLQKRLQDLLLNLFRSDYCRADDFNFPSFWVVYEFSWRKKILFGWRRCVWSPATYLIGWCQFSIKITSSVENCWTFQTFLEHATNVREWVQRRFTQVRHSSDLFRRVLEVPFSFPKVSWRVHTSLYAKEVVCAYQTRYSVTFISSQRMRFV